MSDYKIVPALAKLGPVKVIEEQKHRQGFRGPRYVTKRVYENEDGTIRVTTTKHNGCTVEIAEIERDKSTPSWEIRKTGRVLEKRWFLTVKLAIKWLMGDE